MKFVNKFKNRKGSVIALCLAILVGGGCFTASAFMMKGMGEMGADDFHFELRPAEARQQIYDREKEFEKLDENQDGYLSAAEYNGTQKLFDDMDKDHDGRLTMEEAKYMMTFAEIPEGSFIMGTDEPIQAFFEPAEDSGPAHEVNVDAFKMGATEITTAQYAMYLNSALEAGEIVVKLGDGGGQQTRIFIPFPTYVVEGAPGTKYEGETFIHLTQTCTLSHLSAPNSDLLIPENPLNQSWINYHSESNSFYVDPGFEDWPVVYLKWWGAAAFAEYYDLSLPTEAEWEYVASGSRQYDYPTSDGTNSGQRSNYACYNAMNVPNFKDTDTPEEFVGYRLPVGSYDPNPYGVYDLAGNVWEWNLDWYDEDFYQYCMDNGITSNPLNMNGEEPPNDGTEQGGPGQEFSHDAKVCRGGSYNYNEPVTRTQYRFPVYQFIGNDHFGGRVVIRPETTEFNGTH